MSVESGETGELPADSDQEVPHATRLVKDSKPPRGLAYWDTPRNFTLWQPASIGHWAGSADACTESLSQVEDYLKLLFVRQTSPACHNDIRLAQIHLALSRLNHFEYFALQNLRRQSDIQSNDLRIRMRLDFIGVEGSLLQ